jgi:hypothetical protein
MRSMTTDIPALLRFGLAVVLACLCCAIAGHAADRPNILVI